LPKPFGRTDPSDTTSSNTDNLCCLKWSEVGFQKSQAIKIFNKNIKIGYYQKQLAKHSTKSSVKQGRTEVEAWADWGGGKSCRPKRIGASLRESIFQTNHRIGRLLELESPIHQSLDRIQDLNYFLIDFTPYASPF
jgi:hypothetical protein